MAFARLTHRLARTARRAVARSRALSFSFPGPRKLADITKLPLLERESAARVKEIWTEHHAGSPDAVGVALDAAAHAELRARAAPCPMLVLPVHREGGFFTLVAQFQERHFLLAPLETYRADPASASPCLSVALYDELCASKGVGLVRADVVGAQLTRAEGATTLSLLLDAYLEPALYDAHVRPFNLEPARFDFDAWLAALRARLA